MWRHAAGGLRTLAGGILLGAMLIVAQEMLFRVEPVHADTSLTTSATLSSPLPTLGVSAGVTIGTGSGPTPTPTLLPTALPSPSANVNLGIVSLTVNPTPTPSASGGGGGSGGGGTSGGGSTSNTTTFGRSISHGDGVGLLASTEDGFALGVVPPPSTLELGPVSGLSFGGAPLIWPLLILLDVVLAIVALLIVKRFLASAVEIS